MDAIQFTNKSMETWKPVPGWETFYEVSDAGRVRSCDRRVEANHPSGRFLTRFFKGKILAANVAGNGYQMVCLSRPGKRKHFTVHSLVMLAFVGAPPQGHEVCHNDGVRTNNCLSNLRYGTRSENARDCDLHGTRKVRRGSASHSAKLTGAEVAEIRQVFPAMSARALALKFGVTHRTVMAIVKNETWRKDRA